MQFSLYFTNIIGIILMVLVIYSNRMAVRARKTEYLYIEAIAITILFGNLFELLSVLLDGLSFYGARLLLYVLNDGTFLCNLIFCYIWVIFADYRLWKDNQRLKVYYKYLTIVAIILTSLILTTPYHGLVFRITQNNTYERGSLFTLMVIVEYGFLLYSVCLCHWSLKRLGSYIYFPILLYLSPIFIGTIAQAAFYGLLLGWAATSIAVTGIFISLQHGMAFQDPLTDLYNRNYMNFILATLQHESKNVFGGIMLDIDDFKEINDTLGHLVGDKAIKKAGKIIKESIKPNDIAIRYAGDEFVILVKDANEKKLEEIKEKINASCDAFNSQPSKEYNIVFSMGSSIFYTDETSSDRFLHEMDTKMYENKRSHKMKKGM